MTMVDGLVLMAVSAALAQDDFEYIDGDELFESLGLLTTGESPVVGGASLAWESARGVVKVVVTNSGTDVLQIDWNQSSFINEDKEAFGVVPSKVRQIDVEKLVAPDVVPPGASAGVYIFRESRDGDPGLLYDAGDRGERIGVSLALARGGSTVWVSQEFLVDYMDIGGLREMERCRAALHGWRQSEEAVKRPRRTRDWGMGLAGAGLLLAGMAAIPPYTGEDALGVDTRLTWVGMGGASAVTGGLLFALSTKPLREARVSLAAAGEMPDCP
jgi:hypothetical protein